MANMEHVGFGLSRCRRTRQVCATACRRGEARVPARERANRHDPVALPSWTSPLARARLRLDGRVADVVVVPSDRWFDLRFSLSEAIGRAAIPPARSRCPRTESRPGTTPDDRSRRAALTIASKIDARPADKRATMLRSRVVTDATVDCGLDWTMSSEVRSGACRSFGDVAALFQILAAFCISAVVAALATPAVRALAIRGGLCLDSCRRSLASQARPVPRWDSRSSPDSSPASRWWTVAAVAAAAPVLRPDGHPRHRGRFPQAAAADEARSPRC